MRSISIFHLGSSWFDPTFFSEDPDTSISHQRSGQLLQRRVTHHPHSHQKHSIWEKTSTHTSPFFLLPFVPGSSVPGILLLHFVHKDKIKWLTKSIFINVFRHLVNLAGIPDASGFTGHSFRRGGASWAFQAGVPGELIQVCGDWASDAYKKYLEFSMQNKLDLAALLMRNLPH